MNLSKGNEDVIDMEDAKTPFKYIVTWNHIWGSHSKNKLKGFLGPCVQENATNDHPAVYACKFDRTIAKVRFKHKPNVAMRYSLSGDGIKVAQINDKYGKKGLMRIITKSKPMELWLLPVRKNRSLEYLRSEEMKKVRKDSAERRKGQPKRPHKNPTKRGYRNGTGTGRAHMWTSV
jgi:hypothetical protein